jgi:hypothetical protein
MGCWSVYCGISKITIGYGDDVVFIPLVKNKTCEVHQRNYVPFCLPIFGKYNDYGGIDGIIVDFNTKLIETEFNCTIQEFCDYVVNDWHRENDPKKENFKGLEEIKYMWINRNVYDFLIGYSPDNDFERAECFNLGYYKILEKLGFTFIEDTDDKSKKYSITINENVLDVFSNGYSAHNFTVNGIIIEKYLYSLKMLKRQGVDTTYFDGKEMHHVYEFLDYPERIKLFSEELGINPDSYDFMFYVKEMYPDKNFDDLPLKYPPLQIISRRLMKSLDDNICKVLADIKTIVKNIYSGSMRLEPYIDGITPQTGNYRVHQKLLEKFAEINNEIAINKEDWDDEM